MLAKDVAISVVPANEAFWDELQAVLGTRGYHSDCWCQRFKIRGMEWDSGSVPVGKRANRLRKQTSSSTDPAVERYVEEDPRGGSSS